MRRYLMMFVAAIGILPGVAHAEQLTFTQDFIADFQFSLLGGTPINPGPTTPFIDFQAFGALKFTFDASLNDPSMPTTVPITGFSGVLDGVFPNFLLPYTISPNVAFVGGELTDIVRDGNGEVTSANIKDLAAFWELIGPGGLRLYGDAPLLFSGAIGSIPLGFGTILAGPDPFNVYLDTGVPGSDLLVAIGRNRTLSAVPEPASLAMLGMGAVSLLGYARRRKAKLA